VKSGVSARVNFISKQPAGRRNVWACTFLFTCTFLFFVGSVWGQTPSDQSASDVPDSLREAQTCSRVDLRPALEKVGFELIRNRGGRADNFPFAASEMLGLAIEQPISARWFEHWVEDHDAQTLPKLQLATRAILAGKLRPCLEDAVKSEDIESTRLARLRLLAAASQYPDLNPSVLQLLAFFGSKDFARVSLTPFTCRDAERTSAIPHATLTLTESRSTDMIDRSLRSNRLPIIKMGDATEVFAVAGRRLSPGSGRCEYLVRNYEGPSCVGGSCEDGSNWIERETVSRRLKTVWSLEP
jgi:hypothetical protein